MAIEDPDQMRKVFSEESLRRLSAKANPTQRQRDRLRVLTASGPPPSDPNMAADLAGWRARRAAWAVYLDAAAACGLFEGENGTDLTARLRGMDDDAFRSAIAECMVCWFLAGRMKFKVSPKPKGRGNKVLDLVAALPDGGEVKIEIKAPLRERTQKVWNGDEQDLVEKCLEGANKQLGESSRNLVCLVPEFRLPVFRSRHQLIAALLGQEKITFQVNTRTGESTEPENRFFPDGKFLRPIRPPDASGFRQPGFTRVGGVLCLEEAWAVFENENHQESVQRIHEALLAHNPNAQFPLPFDCWDDIPQFAPNGDEYRWSDGHGLYP